MSRTPCPYCNRAVPVQAVMKALAPTMIRCPHCRHRVRLKNVGLLFVAYIVFLVLIIGIFFYALRWHLMTQNLCFVVAIGLITLVEIGGGIVAARIGRFEKCDEDG
jgi:hypothetical protein